MYNSIQRVTYIYAFYKEVGIYATTSYPTTYCHDEEDVTSLLRSESTSQDPPAPAAPLPVLPVGGKLTVVFFRSGSTRIVSP